MHPAVEPIKTMQVLGLLADDYGNHPAVEARYAR
jgi:hypothetical protein